MTRKRRKTFNYAHCQKGFAYGDHLKMHERSCGRNPEKKNSARKYSIVIQVGGGVNNAFKILESTLGSVFQTCYYICSDEELKDLFKSL